MSIWISAHTSIHIGQNFDSCQQCPQSHCHTNTKRTASVTPAFVQEQTLTFDLLWTNRLFNVCFVSPGTFTCISCESQSKFQNSWQFRKKKSRPTSMPKAVGQTSKAYSSWKSTLKATLFKHCHLFQENVCTLQETNQIDLTQPTSFVNNKRLT